MNLGKLSMLQIAFVVMLSSGMTNHVVLIPLLLDKAGRDAWITVIIAMGFTVLMALLLYYVSRGIGQQGLMDWALAQYGRLFTRLLAAAALIYVIPMGLTTLNNTVLWTVAAYLPETPKIAIALLAILYCGLAGYFGIRCIALSSCIFLPLVVLLGYFVMSANFQYKDYWQLMPMLEYGWERVWGAVPTALSGFAEVVMLLFLQHYVKNGTYKLSYILSLSLLLAGLTIGPLLGSIAIFGPEEAAAQRYPAYEQWRIVKIGRFIEHVDFLSIYQWLSGAFIRVSLTVTIALDLLSVWNIRREVAALIISSIYFVYSGLLPIFDVENYRWQAFIENGVSAAYSIGFLLLLAFMTMRQRAGRNV
ncbi:endospore germination permease [Paenibacillus sp. YYML68]|uniref:GerAB/ArcD/ProY family transporter n=1 Tax=Paenibacillus sp. YYML68 TaxID=2909250 RepID=UPI00249398D5|nr:endospore germination permease [Paenibacillus sp. YYML68]